MRERLKITLLSINKIQNPRRNKLTFHLQRSLSEIISFWVFSDGFSRENNYGSGNVL